MPEFINVGFSGIFDKPKVMHAVRDGKRSMLLRAGAFIRTSARSSIRQRKRTADPGSQPSSHVGTLKNLIIFEVDEHGDSLVAGPKLFRSQSTPAPHSLEFGGEGQTSKGKKATYRAFPFIGPALDVNKNKFPELFRGAIKG